MNLPMGMVKKVRAPTLKIVETKMESTGGSPWPELDGGRSGASWPMRSLVKKKNNGRTK